MSASIEWRDKLEQLGLDVIATAPWLLREMFTLHFEPDFNLHSWQQELIAKVREKTEVATPAINFYFKDRALCVHLEAIPRSRSQMALRCSIRQNNKAPRTVKWKYADPSRHISTRSVVTGH